jgi:hypothetical protein
MKDLDRELLALSDQYDSAPDKETILPQILDLWYRQKYLLRIKDSLSKFVA